MFPLTQAIQEKCKNTSSLSVQLSTQFFQALIIDIAYNRGIR